MNLLSEKATNFINLVDKKQRIEQEKELILSFQKRKNELQEVLTGFLEVFRSWVTMQKAMIKCPDLHDIVEPTKALAMGKWHSFSKEPDWLLDKVEFSAFLKAVKGKTNAIAQLLLQAWRVYIEGLMPYIQQETLTIFRKITSFKTDVELIVQHQVALQNYLNRLPSNNDDIEQVKKRCADLHELWKRFGQGSVPNEVLQFLKMASSPTGAPLSMWTIEIEAWLREQNILNDCSIRI